MEGSIQCSLKQLTYSRESHGLLVWGLRAACRLLQVVAVYLALICASWTMPSFYNRISETTQTLSFTLVDTAAPSLQHRAESISASRKVNKVTLAEGNDENITVQVPSGDAQVPLSQSVMVENDGIGSADGDSDRVADEQQTTHSYVVRAEPKIVIASTEDKVTQVGNQHDEVKLERSVEESAKAHVDEADTTKVNVRAEDMDTHEVADVRPENAGEGSSNEDIPSFSEWAQKQLAEAEKKKVHNASVLSASGSVKKLRSKNYASPDCGAKVIAVNPEAGSASSVLSPSRDEYMLNACTSRIWFIVELCEAVQSKKIDLANFELFSSSPKDFTVYVSDRFPSRDWQSVGHFTALDERNIQSFDLHPHLFGKYIKVDLHTHYGSEHFCPVSLFRVYGTSEFEVLETEDEVLETVPEVDDDDDEEPLDMMESGEAPKNLFGSARDAVLSIVKKAAEALGQSGSPQNVTIPESSNNVESVEVEGRSEWCCSPSHIVVCDNCSDALFGKVFQLLSCRRHHLHLLIDLPVVHEGIRESELCADYGLNFVQQKFGAPYPLRPRTNTVDHRRYGRAGFLSAVFPPEYIAALCNVLAIAEKKVVLNVSYETVDVLPLNLTLESHNITSSENSVFHDYLVSPQATCTVSSEHTSQQLQQINTSSFGSVTLPINEKSSEDGDDSVASKIKPTRTLSKNSYQGVDFTDFGSVSLVDSTKIETLVTNKVTDSTSKIVVKSVSADNQTEVEPVPEPLGARPQKVEVIPESHLRPEESDGSAEVYSEEPDLSLDTLLSELKDLDIDTSSASSSVSSSISLPNVVQKESVFLRLSNRIKALERNMSLSGQYLEELSRRYKRQMEEMQRAFDRTLAVVAEESRKGAEREQKQVEMVDALQRQVATLSSAIHTLTAEQNSWQHKMFQPWSVLLLMVTALVIFFACRSSAPLPGEECSQANLKVRKPKRRKSVEGLIGHVASQLGKRRRPSEEALNIIGTYKDLLISELQPTEVSSVKTTLPVADGKRKKRKKRDAAVKCTSAYEEPKFRRRSDSSGVSPVVVVEGEVLQRRASFSELARSYSSPNERTIVSIDEREVSDHHVGVTDDRIDDVVLADVDDAADSDSCSTVNCVDSSKRHVAGSDHITPVNVVLESSDGRTCAPGRVPPKTSVSRTMNGMNLAETRRVVSPSYVKTALSVRNGRKCSPAEAGQQAKLKSDNWRKLYRSSQLSLPNLPPLRNGEGQAHHTNGSAEGKELHRFSSAGDADREHTGRKSVPTGGLKKMMRKFFD